MFADEVSSICVVVLICSYSVAEADLLYLPTLDSVSALCSIAIVHSKMKNVT